jgi:hypothetical protein
MTWSCCCINDDELWMDIGRGEVVELPAKKRGAWCEATTRQ